VKDLLRFVLEHVEDKEVIPLLEGLLEARRELRPTLLKPHDRLRDIVFLDLALDSTVRTAVERGLESLTNAGPLELALIISMVVENLCLSSNNNEELVYCLKDWYHIINVIRDKSDNWALRTKAVLDRTRLALADKAEYYQRILQPTAEYLGGLLGIEQWAIDIFTEEMIRAGSAASLSQLLNRLDPVIRKEAHMGR
jgi:alpha-glucan,water dikinase